MTDTYTQFVNSGFGRSLAKQLGLPAPVPLRRHTKDGPLCDGPVAVIGEGEHVSDIVQLLLDHGIDTSTDAETYGGVVFDMSDARSPRDLAHMRENGADIVKRLGRNARIVVVGTDPDLLDAPAEVATQRALDGFVRSLAKELRSGATANLVYAPVEHNRPAVRNSVEFFLSGRSAFVDGQHVRLDENTPGVNLSADEPLAGKVAVVTGAARGIGAAIVEVLARDGATVVGVDVPAAQDALAKVVNRARGTSLALDVTAPDAGERILQHCHKRHGGFDIVVHNAGITRDKLFVNMSAEKWDQVMAVNLESILQLNEVFLGDEGLGTDGRVICLSSQSGFAGNRGQTNYSATKAGVIGLVDTTADIVADRGITVNAVAPGLIETEMTGRMPFATREVARRLSSLQQGGDPVDVAEAIAWLAQPASGAITGQTLRVCGQNFIGA